MRDCGYNIDENFEEIKINWEPQFPSNEFPIYWATIQFIKERLKNTSTSCVTIKEKLEIAGFNKSTAFYIQECCTINQVYSWEPLDYWIHIYFDVKLNSLSPTPSQEDYHKRFLSGEWQKNQWYEEQIEVVRDKTKKALDVQVIYTSQMNQVPDLVIDGETINLRARNGNIWYHGTNAKNLPSLRDNGILLGKGNADLDFSSSGGFYLSRDIELAKSWAVGRGGRNYSQPKKTQQKKGKAAEANPHFEGYDVVFIYQFDRSSYLGVDLSQNKKDWEDVVNHFRNNISIELTNEELADEIDIAEYIYGPMSGDGSNEGKLTQKKKKQLCIKKLSMTKAVTYNLKGILYILPGEQTEKRKK